LGNLDTLTVSLTSAAADSILQTAAATAQNTSLALSVSGGPILGGAVAASSAATVASLP
jgi:hypothetical protein